MAGPWRLLRGLASIGSYGLGAFASQQASEAAKKLRRDRLATQPTWLELLPDIEATGDVRVMQDAYGTRFAVIAGFWPRATSAVTYGVLAWSLLIELAGGFFTANHWLLDTSVFHHMAAAPAVNPNWASAAILVAVGAVAAVLGGVAFQRRDLAGE